MNWNTLVSASFFAVLYAVDPSTTSFKTTDK